MTTQKLFINDTLMMYDFEGKPLGTTVVIAIYGDANALRRDTVDNG